ncbi:hypothetical protein [Paenibacillus radicis (ex Gao et al. 2016)]|uniref:Uncharacterized protein n=1 Tax=Paenibacillus radicis (ex Gao et al. 2016) TaxID=1737354 RepID=A0A917HTD8_9BACL|nr:hypothetical protein [Paenibacillus radicis (ex Gao et al. 2016)]GGG88605.1 hypothetical protein GCM10010918_53980 [Paenibacillus radicis (ex Gao et al. 2016)]
MRKWIKHQDPDNKYGAAFTLGDRSISVPEGAVISVTRGEQFNIPRLLINGAINQFIMKAMIRNEDLLFAELTGQLQGGTGQTLTIWKDSKRMNRFRTSGSHNFARKFFSWVFYSGSVQSYFLTWEYTGPIPSSEHITSYVKTYGRHYDGGKLIKKANPSKRNT